MTEIDEKFQAKIWKNDEDSNITGVGGVCQDCPKFPEQLPIMSSKNSMIAPCWPAGRLHPNPNDIILFSATINAIKYSISSIAC